MERDVVLANEIVALAPLLPEKPPPILITIDHGPLLTRRQVSNNCLKPHIDPLVVKFGIRHPHSPLYVPSNGPILESLLQKPRCEVLDILAPVCLPVHPCEEIIPEGRKFQEEMFGTSEFRGVSTYLTSGISQVRRIQGLATSITLITPSTCRPAVRTCPFHITIRQIALTLGTVGQRHSPSIHIAFL